MVWRRRSLVAWQQWHCTARLVASCDHRTGMIDRPTDRSVELCKMGRARGTKGTPAPGTLILNLRASSYVPIPDSAPAAVPPPPAEGRAPPCLQLSLTASNIFTFCMESW